MPLTQGVIDTQPLPRVTGLVASTTVPSTLSNPHTGAGTLGATVGGIPAYALVWRGFGGPAGAGRQNRTNIVWEQDFLSLALVYLLADSSYQDGDNVLTRFDHGVIWFDHGPVTEVRYDILSGWAVEFRWLVAP